MSTKQITDENFDQVIADNDIVLLVFWAVWSAHAQRYSYAYSKISDKYPDIVFGTVEGEKYPELSKGFGVTTVPETILIREGITIFRHVGQLKDWELDNIVEGALAVDMDDIRRQLAEQKGSGEPSDE